MANRVLVGETDNFWLIEHWERDKRRWPDRERLAT
jgi:hypothetical protein